MWWDYKTKYPSIIFIAPSALLFKHLNAYLGTPKKFNKARVILSLYLSKQRNKKNRMGDGGISPAIPDVSMRWREWGV